MNIKAGHFRHELSTWVRVLGYQQQENIYLKNYLAEILKNSNSNMLDKIEFYQSQLINIDTLIALLRYDIGEQNKTLENTAHKITRTFLKAQERLRADMEKMERELNRQKYDLNSNFSTLL